MAVINGTPGNDGIEGTGGADTINGLDGHDTLVGLGGNDTLNGGDGDDLLAGGAGQDLLDGGAGYDLAVFSLSTSAVTVDLRITIAQNTGEGSDILRGIEGLIGSNHNDWLSGDSWHNLIAGGLGSDQIFGHAGDDELIGNEGADRLEGGDGDDILTGAAGNDIVIGGAGFDLAAFHTATAGVHVDLRITTAQNTGEGSDTLTGVEDLLGSDFSDVLIGDDGSNYINGGLGADSLSGGGGDDVLAMQGGAAVSAQVNGGSGYDTFTVLNGGTLTGSTFTGVEHLHSGYSLDLGANQFDDFQKITAYYVTVSTGGLADLRNTDITAQTIHAFSGGGVLTLSGNALRGYTIWGLYNADNITGGALNDLIRGFGGADTLNGDAGDDFIQGEDGDDLLFGGTGVDALDGGHGADVLRGGDDSDGLNGGYGNDILYGEDGDDHLADDMGNNILDGGAGDDTLTVNSYAADGSNQLFGGIGDDTLVYQGSRERLYSATYDGGAGYDTFRVNLDYSSTDPTPIADLTGFALDTFEQVDGRHVRMSIAQIEMIDIIASNLYVSGSGLLDFSGRAGGPGAFHFGDEAIILDLTGSHFGIRVHGGGGDDEVRGGVNSDYFEGGAGDDVLLGAEGDDILVGQAGEDILHGGEGHDIAYLPGVLGDYQIVFEGETLLITGTGGLDTLISIEDIRFEGGGGRFLLGSAEDDQLTGSEADDILFGGDGADFVNGVSGDDTISGGGGDDELWGYGGADTIDGGAGDDLIRGFHGDDVITGGGGDDRIDGAYDGSGGGSTDIAVYKGNRADYVVIHAAGYHYVAGPDGIDTLLNIDFLRFADGQNALSALAQEGTVLTGGASEDTLSGTTGFDLLRGNEGNDTISGLDGDDLLTGGLGDDRIDGGSGQDVLIVSGVASGYRLLMNGDDFILKGPDGGDSLTGIESIRFGDGRVLELNRMYGPDVDDGAWVDGRIPEALLTGGGPAAEGPQVLPGVDDSAKGGASDPQVLPGADDRDRWLWKDDDAPLVLPGVDVRVPVHAKDFGLPEVLPGPADHPLFRLGPNAPTIEFSGWRLMVDDQGLVEDFAVRGGRWGADDWAL